MLPTLLLLESDALETATHASKRQKEKEQGNSNISFDLPKDLRERVLELVTDGPGVPLLLVQNIRYYWDTQLNQYLQREDIFYIRLPDPADGPLDVRRFATEGYAYDQIFQGIVDLAGYNKTTTKTEFINVRSTDGDLRPELIWDDGNDDVANVHNLIDNAIMEAKMPVDKQSFFGRNKNGEQLLFASLPTFKSHVAIVMTVEDNE